MDQQPKKIGRIRGGWLMTKSSWRVLKLDKELMSFPILSLITQIALIIGLLIVGIIVFSLLNGSSSFHDSGASSESIGYQPTTGVSNTIVGFVIGLPILFVLYAVANYFAAALTHGALTRFKGGNPTVGSSLKGIRPKIGSILKFSLFQAVIVNIIYSIADRLPLLGNLLVSYIGEVALRVATFFAIPVIVDSKEKIGPWQATKKSMGILKQVWGESIVVNLGITIIAAITTLAYICVFAGIFYVGAGLSLGLSWAIFGGVVALFGLVGLSLIFQALGSIATAAIYHFAITGQSPVEFDKELIKQSITSKKARKIFG